MPARVKGKAAAANNAIGWYQSCTFEDVADVDHPTRQVQWGVHMHAVL